MTIFENAAKLVDDAWALKTRGYVDWSAEVLARASTVLQRIFSAAIADEIVEAALLSGRPVLEVANILVRKGGDSAA